MRQAMVDKWGSINALEEAQEVFLEEIEEVYGCQTFRVLGPDLHLTLYDIGFRMVAHGMTASMCPAMAWDMDTEIVPSEFDIMVGYADDGQFVVGVYPIFPKK